MIIDCKLFDIALLQLDSSNVVLVDGINIAITIYL